MALDRSRDQIVEQIFRTLISHAPQAIAELKAIGKYRRRAFRRALKAWFIERRVMNAERKRASTRRRF